MSFPRCFFNILYHLSGSNIQLCAVCVFLFLFFFLDWWFCDDGNSAMGGIHDDDFATSCSWFYFSLVVFMTSDKHYTGMMYPQSRLNTVSKRKKGKGNNRACKQMVLVFFFNSKEVDKPNLLRTPEYILVNINIGEPAAIFLCWMNMKYRVWLSDRTGQENNMYTNVSYWA